MPDATQFPPRLLSEAIWRFWEEDPYEDQSIFTARVTEHGRRVIQPGPYDWAPDAVAIRTPRLRVKYFGADPEDDFEYANYEVTLASSDGREFTNRELLFKLHNAVVRQLRTVDHCYFEGLELVDTASPIYEMQQGS
jgi:hypothetical protein